MIAWAVDLARAHTLRGYDAVQLAAALRTQAALTPETLTLVTADRKMYEVARAEGMDVIDPTAAPV